MKDTNDIIDIPTELEIEVEPEVVEPVLEVPEIEIPSIEPKNPEIQNEQILIMDDTSNNNEPITNEASVELPNIEIKEIPAATQENEQEKTIEVIPSPTMPDLIDEPLQSQTIPVVPEVVNQPMEEIKPKIESNNTNQNAVAIEQKFEETLQPQAIPMVPEASTETDRPTEPKIESIDGNPDVLDMELKSDAPKTTKSKKPIIMIIILALVVISGGALLTYKFLINKPKQKDQPKLIVKNLKSVASFEEAYNRVLANFNDSSEGEETSYIVEDGVINYNYKDTSIKLNIESTKITQVSFMKKITDSEVIAIKDDKNNHYFANIKNSLKEDTILTKENSNLIKIEDKNVENIAIANYLNKEGIFYLAVQQNENYFVSIDDDNNVKLTPVHLKVYNGINIDFDDLSINKSEKKKLALNGVGLFYDNTLYLYKGDISDIEEIRVSDADEAILCKEIILATNSQLQFCDLYVITEEDDLYKINLLASDVEKEKVELKKYENKVVDYTVSDSVNINLENGEKINLK